MSTASARVSAGALTRAVPAAVARLRAVASTQLGRRLVTSTFWSATSESLSRGLLFVGMILVARTLNTAAYGEFGLVRSTINMFAAFGGMGLGLTANRFVAEHRTRNPRLAGDIAGSSLLVATMAGLIVGLAVLVAAPWLATVALHAPQLEWGLRLSAFMLLLGAVNGAQMGVLQGLEAYQQLAIGSVIQGIVAVVGLTVGAKLYGLDGALLGLLSYMLAGVVALQWQMRVALARGGITLRFRAIRATLPIFLAFSLPVMLSGVAIAPLRWFAETLVVRTVGFAELGLFHAAMTIATMLTALVSTLHAPLLSVTANAGGSRRVERTSLYGGWYASLVLTLPLLLFPSLAALVLGAKFDTPAFRGVVVLLAAYVALMMYYQGVLRLIALRGSMWFALGTNLLEGAALIAAFVWLGKRGALGLGVAYVASYVVRIAITLPVLARGSVIRPDLLWDRGFLLSLAALCVLVTVQLRGVW
ncbi:MAG: oligosaccharide flippase family protein [Gemmatimonadota bacterium]